MAGITGSADGRSDRRALFEVVGAEVLEPSAAPLGRGRREPLAFLPTFPAPRLVLPRLRAGALRLPVLDTAVRRRLAHRLPRDIAGQALPLPVARVTDSVRS